MNDDENELKSEANSDDTLVNSEQEKAPETAKRKRGRPPADKPKERKPEPEPKKRRKPIEEIVDTRAAILRSREEMNSLIARHVAENPESRLVEQPDPFDVLEPPRKKISPEVCGLAVNAITGGAIVAVRVAKKCPMPPPVIPREAIEPAARALSEASIYLPINADLDKWLTIFAVGSALAPLAGLVFLEWQNPGVLGSAPLPEPPRKLAAVPDPQPEPPAVP